MSEMGLITLTTDFGTDSSYVGIMKGAILSINPLAAIIDLTHGIKAWNLLQAAFTIKGSFKYFPAGTIHIVVVDPGVGTDRKILALKSRGHVFLAPDNGVLDLVMDHAGPRTLVRVENDQYFLKPVSHTFHGRDIFSPVAAHLSLGLPLEKLGVTITRDKINKLEWKHPVISSSGVIRGRVAWIDGFGNLITDIEGRNIEQLSQQKKDFVTIVGKGGKIKGLSRTYKRVPPKCPLAIINSDGYLEISVNCGSAMAFFNSAPGDTITCFSENVSQ